MFDYYLIDGLYYVVNDNSKQDIATTKDREDAREIVDALRLKNFLRHKFPGLENGVADVNGADLVQYLSEWFQET